MCGQQQTTTAMAVKNKAGPLPGFLCLSFFSFGPMGGGGMKMMVGVGGQDECRGGWEGYPASQNEWT